jgi:hypothetical protein
VEIQSFQWEKTKGFKPNLDYTYELDKKKFFIMKVKVEKKGLSTARHDSSEIINYVDPIALSAHDIDEGRIMANAILLQDEQK